MVRRITIMFEYENIKNSLEKMIIAKLLEAQTSSVNLLVKQYNSECKNKKRFF